MNTDIDLIDFMDLINFTLHKDFVEKWRYKYSEKFVKHFEVIQVTQMTDSHGFWLLLKPKELYVKEKELHLKTT